MNLLSIPSVPLGAASKREYSWQNRDTLLQFELSALRYEMLVCCLSVFFAERKNNNVGKILHKNSEFMFEIPPTVLLV